MDIHRSLLHLCAYAAGVVGYGRDLEGDSFVEPICSPYFGGNSLLDACSNAVAEELGISEGADLGNLRRPRHHHFDGAVAGGDDWRDELADDGDADNYLCDVLHRLEVYVSLRDAPKLVRNIYLRSVSIWRDLPYLYRYKALLRCSGRNPYRGAFAGIYLRYDYQESPYRRQGRVGICDHYFGCLYVARRYEYAID